MLLPCSMAGKVLTRHRKNRAGEYTSWEYRFQSASIDGKRKWITQAGFATKQEAYNAGMTAYQEYQNTGVHFTPSEISVSDYMQYWIKEYCETNLKETTITNYKKKIKNIILPEIGKYKLCCISTITLQQFINRIFHAGYARNTLIVVKGILTNAFRYAKQHKLIQENPMLEVTLPRKTALPKQPSRTKQRSCVQAIDIQRIFKRFPDGHPVHIPLLLGYRCGLRHGEAYALQWEDIDFERNLLYVRRQIQYREGETDVDGKSVLYFSNPKYNSTRTVQLDDQTIDLLRRTKEKQEASRQEYGEYYVHYYEEPHTRILNTDGIGKELYFVNCNSDGSLIKPRTMQHASNVIHKELNIPTFDYHSLRHTHCTELLEAGVPPKVVQIRLGHKDIRTTLNIYEHVTQKMEQNTQDILNQMYPVSTLCPLMSENQQESNENETE